MGFSAMNEASASLDDLRRQIDEIDRMLHDQLMRRCDLVLRIGALKDGAARTSGAEAPNHRVHYRPAREASMLRRLVAHHRGPLPKASLVRIWQEIIAASLQMEAPLTVAVYRPLAGSAGCWDLARVNFGGITRFVGHETPHQVLGAVMEGEASVGVLPMPEQGASEQWWRRLMATDRKVPRVVARLPFGAPVADRGERVEALVVAPVPPEETGRDLSLIAIETREEVSRGSFAAAFRSEGLEPAFLVSGLPATEGGDVLHLLELPSFLSAEDERIARIAAKLERELRQIWLLGSYAEPLSAAELGLDGKTKGIS